MNDKSGTGRMGVVVKRDWKRLCCMTLLAAMALPGRAFAESGDGFRIDGSGQVVLDSDHAAKEGVSSLCFSLTVEAGAGDTVTFEFSGSNASVMEYRYNKNDNTMNIYLAGTNPLFAEGTQSLDIGRVVVQGGNGGQGSAVVGVEDGSLQYVYGSQARTMEGVSNPGDVQLGNPAPTVTPPGETQPPDATQPPDTTQPPDATQTPPQETQPPTFTQRPGGTGGDSGNSGNSWQPPAESTRAPVEDTQTAGGRRPVIGGTKPTNSPKPEKTSRPSPSPSPSPTPEIEKVELDPSDESETAGEDQEALAPVIGAPDKGSSGGGFWETVKPVLIGFAIAVSVAGAGAAQIGRAHV